MWLVLAFWIVVLMAVAPGVVWMNADEFYGDVVESVMVGISGVVVGMLCFVAVLSALRWRSWGLGYVVGIAVLDAGLLALILSFWLADNHDSDGFLALALFPPVLLSLACPLFVCRYLFGWRLVGSGESTPQRDTFRLEDLFTLTTVVAANLVLLRIPQVHLEESSEEYWLPMLTFCGLAFAIGLFVLPVVVRLAFVTKRRHLSIGGLALLAMAVPGCIFGMAQFAAPPDVDWSQQLEALQAVMTACGGAFVALYASLFTLVWGGMSLVKTSRAESAVGGQEKPQHASNRWLASGSVAVAILASLSLSRVEQQRREVDKENERLSTIAQRFGGEISVVERRVMAVVLGQRAADRDLDQFLECTDVTYIDLSESAITDLGVAKLNYFPRAELLKLNYTQVTDEGLAKLSALDDLDWIELHATKVKGTGFAEWNTTNKLLLLELDNTPFADAGCLALRRFSNLAHLSLSGTHITDTGLQHLSELKKLTSLNVANTSVTGDALSKLTRVTRLVLDGALIDDASTLDIMTLTQLWTLDLSNTAITDATVEQLRSLTALHHLTLTGTKVKGAGFRDWEGFSELETLTLAQTALTDENATHLKHHTNLTELDISGTDISDASLPIFAQMALESLDLCNTKVTGAGLLATEFERYVKLHIASDQASQAEIEQLDKNFKLTITMTGETNTGND